MTPQGDPNRIPLARRRDCEQCGALLDTKADGVARLCTTWVANRAAGGANSLIAPVYQERYLCRSCTELKRKHPDISWQQGRLL